MGEIDWNKIYHATSKANQPTPGYLFNEIVRDVSYAHPKEIPAVAAYLADCVDGDHAHVKLKALFVIKSLAYRVPPFCACMQERLPTIQEAAVFTGPPSALFGDEPYRLVREAADGALNALTGGEYYHEQYREMSQRIVGFGNYQPAEDTVLADGSINVGRDVTYRDLTLGTVGLIQSGVGALLGGVKEILASPFAQKRTAERLGVCSEAEDGDDVIEGTCVLGRERTNYCEDLGDQDDDEEPGIDEDGLYRHPVGSYVPPSVPELAARGSPESANGARTGETDDDDVYRPGGAVADATAIQGTLTSPAAPNAAIAADIAEEANEEAALLRLLGLPASGVRASTTGLAAERRCEEDSDGGELSEAAILDILGLAGGSGIGASAVQPQALIEPSLTPLVMAAALNGGPGSAGPGMLEV